MLTISEYSVFLEVVILERSDRISCMFRWGFYRGRCLSRMTNVLEELNTHNPRFEGYVALCYYDLHMTQSSGTTYYIFRHGETFATKRWNGFYGWRVFTAPILEEEKPMLYRLAEFMKDHPTDYNASSQILRCRQTSGIVSEVTGKEFVYDRRLREFFFESFGQLRRRVRSFLNDVEAKKYTHVAICTHGAVIAELAMELLAHSAEVPIKRVFPQPGELYIIKDGKLEKKNFR